MNEKTCYKCKFASPEYGELRAIYDLNNNVALFCAKDVAKTLGYANPSASVRDICTKAIKESHVTDGGLQVMNFIDWEDIRNLFKHSRKKDHKYISYLCDIEQELINKADDDKYEDVRKFGDCSDYCEEFCEDCKYAAVCPDCDCEYEDTHNPEFKKLIEKNNPEKERICDFEAFGSVLKFLNDRSKTYRDHSSQIESELLNESNEDFIYQDVFWETAKNLVDLAEYLKDKYGASLDIKKVRVDVHDGHNYDLDFYIDSYING